MKRSIRSSVPLCFCVFFLFLVIGTGAAEDKTVLTGKVSDVDGRAVEGVRVFVYNSPEVRRPAEFISALTGKDGLYYIVLRPGKYWVVARLKKAEGYGPLMPGDKHSGDPREIDLASGGAADIDFVVADLKDAIKMRAKTKEGPLKITGKVIDESGSPVGRAYVFAGRSAEVSGIPDYLSAWTDDEGRYTLYIPRGKYYIGTAAAFPPGKEYLLKGEMTFDVDRNNVDIVRKTGDK